MKAGIVVIAELSGSVAERIHEVQQRYDPRMAAELPPHLTLIGSSGMGPISVRTSAETLREALLPVTQATPRLTLRFDPPIRFMQSNVVVLPLDPNGPVRALHEAMAERIRAAHIVTERARFTFTPHCTLNLYRELPERAVKELLGVRFEDSMVVEEIQAYRSTGPTGTQRLFELGLAKT
ncbi:MAG TPA: 2'-5' RNA ligase family protein [Gemmatimonadaceae bacterium]